MQHTRSSRETLWPKALHHQGQYTTLPYNASSGSDTSILVLPSHPWLMCISLWSQHFLFHSSLCRPTADLLQSSGRSLHNRPALWVPAYTRALHAQANLYMMPLLNVRPLVSFLLMNVERLGRTGSPTHSYNSLWIHLLSNQARGGRKVIKHKEHHKHLSFLPLPIPPSLVEERTIEKWDLQGSSSRSAVSVQIGYG